jgi:hypothetical protein
MVVGLALGGCLADPVVNVAWLFGPNGLFNISGNEQGVVWAVNYPYALPAMFNGLMLGSALFLSVLFLRETLAGREDDVDIGIRYGRFVLRTAKRVIRSRQNPGYAALALDDFGDTPPLAGIKPAPRGPPPSKVPVATIWTRDVIAALVSFALLPLHNGAFMHIFPVFLSHPPTDHSTASLFHFNGGLGLKSPSIGLWLALLGICGIMLQLFIYPRLQARIGTLGNFRVALYMFPVTYLIAPYLSFLAPKGFGNWFCIILVAWSQVMARTLAIPSTVILLTNAAPAKHVLGTVHGAGNMATSLARAVGPAVGGWVYAWGIDHDMIGAVWWFYLFFIAVCALVWSYRMRPAAQ